MKKLLFLLIGIFLCNLCLAQCYHILGKGGDGKTPCSGKIFVGEEFNDMSYKIIIEIDDIQKKTWRAWQREIVNERTVSYKVTNLTPQGNIEDFDIIMQKCNVNPNVYFFVLPKLYGGKGTEIYKTRISEDIYECLKYYNIH